MNNLRVTFDKTDTQLLLSDSLETGECRVVITYPDGIVQDLGKILKLSNDWAYSLASRTDLFGNYMEGEYAFLFERYDVGGTTPTSTDSGTFTLSVDAVTPEVTVTNDSLTPSLRLTDSTDWNAEIDGVWTIDTLLRIWNAQNGLHYFGPSSQATLSLFDSGYFTGTYTYTITADTAYNHENGWVSVKLSSETSGEFIVKQPVMLPEILALLNCLYAKIIAKQCCKDATYDEMQSDYIKASAMFSSFVLNGQADITSSQASLLFGSDCELGILGILRKWGCYDDTLTEAQLASYDYCLCDTGGGGGTVASREGYDAGNGCFLTSDATDDDDRWTFAVASGIGSFTQNLAGSRIFGGTVRGDDSTATHTSNSATNSFKLNVPVPGELANLGYASALLASTSVWSSPNSDPTAAAPWVLDEGSVQKRIVGIASGVISFVFAGIGATYPDGWAITFETP